MVAQLLVHNPATGDVVAELDGHAAADVPAAAERARRAQVGWAARPLQHRVRVLTRFHDLVLARADEVLDTCQVESGKARRDALAELWTVVGTARYYAAHGGRHLREQAHRAAVPGLTRARVSLHPHGLVGLISPWNFPFLLGIADALPALLAGNAVLAKPSELTPMSALLARRLLVESGLDPDLLQVLVGPGGELGPAIIDAVDYVGFTGSTEIGRSVARHAADRLIPCSLELGGKNPLLVLPGARVEDAVAGLMTGAFGNAGQTCISVERAYVHEHLWDEFVERAAEAAEALRVGWSLGWDMHVGSLASVEHATKVLEHVDDARTHGATVVTGGNALPELGPAFVQPTLLTGVRPGMRMHDEETFGPVVALRRVGSTSEAVELANRSDFGLNASVWAGTQHDGVAVARRLEVGSANVNSTLLVYNSFDVPMGGIRQSGLGRRHGADGILRYVRRQSIVSSFARGGGYEQLIGWVDSPRRARAMLLVARAWRHVPVIR